jgi:hypothetical protein
MEGLLSLSLQESLRRIIIVGHVARSHVAGSIGLLGVSSYYVLSYYATSEQFNLD